LPSSGKFGGHSAAYKIVGLAGESPAGEALGDTPANLIGLKGQN